jgi:hypothetical protein
MACSKEKQNGASQNSFEWFLLSKKALAHGAGLEGLRVFGLNPSFTDISELKRF